MNLNKIIWENIIKTILLLIGIYLTLQIWQILMVLFLVIIVSTTLRPLVEYLETRRIPRAVSALSVLIVLIAGIFALTQSVVQEVVTQWDDLSDRIGENYEFALEQTGLDQYLDSDTEIGSRITQELNSFLTNNIENLSTTIIDFSTSLFSGFLTLVTSISLIFYLLYDPEKPKRFLISFLPKKNQKLAMDITAKTEKKLSYWLAGQLFIMFCMSIVSYIGLALIGVEFALPLAVLIGILDIIPVVGPIIAFIPVILVVLVTSPVKVILVSIFYILLQQLEGNLLVPRIMSKSVGLDPVAIIVALMIGSSLFGILGALLSIPVSVILMILYEEWQKNR